MVTLSVGQPETVLMMSFYGNLDAGEPAFKATGRVKRGAWREPETEMLCQGQPGTHCLMPSGFLLQMAEGDQGEMVLMALIFSQED